MENSLKVFISLILCGWIVLAFHYGWAPLIKLLPISLSPNEMLWKDYPMFWLLGICLGSIWLKSSRELYFLMFFPPLFLIGYGGFLKLIQWTFGYGEVHKTFRQLLSLFRSPGFILLFFGWKLLRKYRYPQRV